METNQTFNKNDIVRYNHQLGIVEIPSKPWINIQGFVVKSLNTIMLEDKTLVSCFDEDLEFISHWEEDEDE